MLKRIASIGLIFLCSTLAWIVLAANISARTQSSLEKLGPDLASSWGTAQEQLPPAATLELAPANSAPIALDIERSRIHVWLALEYRQKGLLWYSTYVVRFNGTYTFRNSADQACRVLFTFPLPAKQAIYDDLTISANGQPLQFKVGENGPAAAIDVTPGHSVDFGVNYQSRGLDSWRYNPGKDGKQVRDFELTLSTNFRDIDFPSNTLSPVSKRTKDGGWELLWQYRNLISGFEIGVTMPQKLQPGPLAGEISTFAPVSLLLFFFVLFVVAIRRQVELHAMNYFFLAAAFFSFHLLMAYAVDHISIQWAFALSSLVSVGLVVSYLRLVVGPQFAIKEAGLAQFVYLVLFSLSFFLKGFTGLAITIGCIVTLFVAMQVTARVRWRELFDEPGARR